MSELCFHRLMRISAQAAYVLFSELIVLISYFLQVMRSLIINIGSLNRYRKIISTNLDAMNILHDRKLHPKKAARFLVCVEA